MKNKKLSSFQIVILGFLGVILVGALLLVFPFSSKTRQWTSFENALFTSTSAVCVTGLVVKDTASYWSIFGQAVILVLIQIGGLGIVSVAAFIAAASGRKISLLERSMLQDSISAHQIGGIVKLMWFVFRFALIAELSGALILLPTFIKAFGAHGIWMSVFHSVSAFCNAGFDIMGDQTGEFSSLTYFCSNLGVIIPVCLLILFGGIGFLTWDDIAANKFKFKKYRMQSKVILITNAVLILIPAALMFVTDFTDRPFYERLCLAVFQTITPRTAGFNTADLSAMSGTGRLLIVILMLIGGSPGSTAGGMKTTTAAVLFANAISVFRRKKNARMFGRRIEDGVVKSAATLLLLYIFLSLSCAFIISAVEGLPLNECIFETASALGTAGLSMGITPSLGLVSHIILIILMFLGRVGGLTLIFAALGNKGAEVSQCPVEKIVVG